MVLNAWNKDENKWEFGRSNISATIHVPSKCKNNCKFCINNKYYNDGSDIDRVLQVANDINYYSKIKEVVISGGEPAQDIEELSKIVSKLTNKPVYINTTLPWSTFDSFCHLVNSRSNIVGINISRHAETYKEESLNNLTIDSNINEILKPKRINVYLSDKLNINKVIKRWWKYNISVCFRRDFRHTNLSNLHKMDAPKELLKYDMISYERCHVCNNMAFTDGVNKVFYHKGIQNTLINFGSWKEINDIIVLPSGKTYADWNLSTEFLI